MSQPLPLFFSPYLRLSLLKKKKGECEQIIDRDNQADRHKAGQGGGGERQSVFEISCILMSSSCSINDDLCHLQIEYSPVWEGDRDAADSIYIKSALMISSFLSFLHVKKTKKNTFCFHFVPLILLLFCVSSCFYLSLYISSEGNYSECKELILKAFFWSPIIPVSLLLNVIFCEGHRRRSVSRFLFC